MALSCNEKEQEKGRGGQEKPRVLESAFFSIRKEFAVSNDDVVEEKEAKKVASFFQLSGELVVGSAWLNVITGMIVAEHHYSGVAQKGFFHHKTNVDSRFCYASFRQLHRFDELVALIKV